MSDSCVDGQISDQAAYLAGLRKEFPEFGIVADFRRPIWMAVWGDRLLLKASDGLTLRERLVEVSRAL